MNVVINDMNGGGEAEPPQVAAAKTPAPHTGIY